MSCDFCRKFFDNQYEMKMRILSKNFIKNLSIAFLLSLAMTSLAIAGGTQTGKITFLTIRGSDGLVLIELAGSPANKPGCALYTYWILKDETSLTGKQQLALLTAAKVAGQTVAISGTGSCTRWHDGEDIDTIQLQ
jgi:hypothetical protein